MCGGTCVRELSQFLVCQCACVSLCVCEVCVCVCVCVFVAPRSDSISSPPSPRYRDTPGAPTFTTHTQLHAYLPHTHTTVQINVKMITPRTCTHWSRQIHAYFTHTHTEREAAEMYAYLTQPTRTARILHTQRGKQLRHTHTCPHTHLIHVWTRQDLPSVFKIRTILFSA